LSSEFAIIRSGERRTTRLAILGETIDHALEFRLGDGAPVKAINADNSSHLKSPVTTVVF